MRSVSSTVRFDALMRPKSIALVGASSSPGSLGASVLGNLERAEFRGELYLVNPKRKEINGRPCLSAVQDLPLGVDCAVLAIPGPGVLQEIRACASRAVRSVIVFSAGFAESGEEGKLLQQEIARIANEHGMIVEGPNCLGMVNFIEKIPLTFVVTETVQQAPSRGVAIVSQSGALAAVVTVNMQRHKIRLCYSVSTGNEASSGVEDFVEYLLDDPHTRVLALVVEQFRHPRRFLDLARRARGIGKFLVLLHPGSSSAARAAAATHTGAMAGDYEVMKTLVADCGVIQVETLEEFVDVSQILVLCRTLPVGGAAIFTESGAFKALALDICERLGLNLPALSLATEQSLLEILPSFVPPSNPLDLTAHALVDPTLYSRSLVPILADNRFGSVLLGIILTDETTAGIKLPSILSAVESLRPSKPVLFAALDEGAPFDFPELDSLRRLGVPCFPSPERALRALARVSTLRTSEFDSSKPSFSAPISTDNLKGTLSEHQSKALLESVGIPFADAELATTLDKALHIAVRIGFPVVLKAQSADLPHKSDVGGVILGLSSEDEVRSGWETLHRNLNLHRPGLVLDGVLVQRMYPQAVEIIVGARNDPQWGPVLLAGLGGVLAEALHDVVLMPAHLAQSEVKNRLLTLQASALFNGFRGSPALDIDALAAIIVSLGDLIRSSPSIREIDINPVRVFPKGHGAIALDALIHVEGN